MATHTNSTLPSSVTTLLLINERAVLSSPGLDLYAHLYLVSSHSSPTIPDSSETEDLNVVNCLVHLKLMHAFQSLKEDIGYTDGLWGIWNTRAEIGRINHQSSEIKESYVDPICLSDDEKIQTLSKLREKRWAVYVARAVERYEAWWLSFYEPSLTQKDMAEPKSTSYEAFHMAGDSLDWNGMIMPPLDVLLIFHTHMLNPRAFLEDALRYGASQLWTAGMPWDRINKAIDGHFNYHVSEENKARWFARTGCRWDNTDDTLTKTLSCPSCKQRSNVAWTTCDLSEYPSTTERPGLAGCGYGDGRFQFPCSCGLIITKQALSVKKFANDINVLVKKGIPMPGTILDSSDGLPRLLPTTRNGMADHRGFPNRIIQSTPLRYSIPDLLSKSNWPVTMQKVVGRIERVLKDDTTLSIINRYGFNLPLGAKTPKLPKQCRINVRKMMSRYWGNSGPFALDLASAVMRQGSFVEKMVKIDWLHSPSVAETMTRLLTKYNRFFEIIKSHPLNVAVPTLDIDLAWHTHQLRPRAYYQFSTALTGKFIDHDDRIGEHKLSDAFEWTSRIYQGKYGERYSECTCWYCEAIRASHSSSVDKLLGKLHLAPLQDEKNEADLFLPNNSIHISAHNAITFQKPYDKAKQWRVYKQLRDRHQAKLLKNYTQARRRAEKKGQKLPPKDEFYSHWGYSYALFAPYSAPGFISPNMYSSSDPCNVRPGDGTWGTCCNGNCSSSGACGYVGGSEGAGVAEVEAPVEVEDVEVVVVVAEEVVIKYTGSRRDEQHQHV
ncbi:hypothetical protein B0T10DRAFT_535886 [Thelonectria olida]|uniref:Uncharacterized protein n=1 Tax=Thelonectria olida TaxID=1576542 RepID=A0A9P8WI61_9HYPO|nr:hypothetical protein B0T10DRAFT_535886 [Thelonectria olida]